MTIYDYFPYCFCSIELQQKAIHNSSDTCLMSFDTSKPVTLQVDVSQVGLGAVLLRVDSLGRTRPVAYKIKGLSIQ